MFEVKVSLKKLNSFASSLPESALILGSGWNKVMDQAVIEQEIPYSEIFGQSSGVPGHAGKLVIASLGKKRVVCMSGRFHTYEGYSTEEVTRPIQVMAAMGVKNLIVTAAVGALNESYRVGDFVILRDMVTMFCRSPLHGAQFIDLSQAFDPELRIRAKTVAAKLGLSFQEGVYIFTGGPHFETPADKMMLHHLGGDVIGMSTVPETIMARSLNMKVLGLSYVTNLAFVKHEHKDVLAAAELGSKQMSALLSKIISK